MAAAHARGEDHPALLTETIGEALERTARRWPERDALVDVGAGRRWTYRQFVDDVRRLAAGLHAAGLQQGDRVGIWSPNRWEWPVVQFATAEIGVILVTINPAYRTHELAYVLKR